MILGSAEEGGRCTWVHSWYSSMDGEHGGDCAMSAWKCEYVFSFILVVVEKEKEKEVSVSEVLKVERWHKQTSG